MRLEKYIEISDVYDYDELMKSVPFFKDAYSVVVTTYGYLHDVGIVVCLTLDNQGNGWATLKEDFEKKVDYCLNLWKCNSEFGYH